MSRRWPRDAYAQAVWRSDLKTVPKLIALAYADWAGNTNPPEAWITNDKLVQLTRASHGTVVTARKQLVELGWLTPKSAARGGRVSPVFLLVEPSSSRTVEPSSTWTVSSVQPSNPAPQPSNQPSKTGSPTVQPLDATRSTSLRPRSRPTPATSTSRSPIPTATDPRCRLHPTEHERSCRCCAADAKAGDAPDLRPLGGWVRAGE